MQKEQGTKHAEAGSSHKFTQMFTVVIGYLWNYQLRIIKRIRESKILKLNTLMKKEIVRNNPYCKQASMYVYKINGVSNHVISHFSEAVFNQFWALSHEIMDVNDPISMYWLYLQISLFVWSFRPTREFFTHFKSSPLTVKGCKLTHMAIDQ